MRANSGNLLTGLAVAALFCILFILLRFPENEGFSPTDDGVVPAQSWRLLHGEVPHRDFISIRPALSGWIHTVHFFSPLPLAISGRWFVTAEIFFFSFLFAWLITGTFAGHLRKGSRLFLFAAAGIPAFILNLNTFHLYPWTTIDGVCFSVCSIVLFARAGMAGVAPGGRFNHLTASLWLAAMAALCKQNFLFLWLFLSAWIFLEGIFRKKRGSAILIPVAGILPLVLYILYLWIHGALDEFISQMTGRTELFETGILRYVKSFIKAWLMPFNLALIAAVIAEKAGIYRKLCAFLKRGIDVIVRDRGIRWKSILVIYTAVLVAGLSVFFFYRDYKTVPFEFFWALTALLSVAWARGLTGRREAVILIPGIVLAWTSSISLGANSPIYTFGILAVMNAYIIYLLLDESWPGMFSLSWFRPAVALMLIALVAVSIYGQRRFNYRDRPSRELTCDLGTLIPAFGHIHTNPVTFEYYEDFMKLWNNYELKNRFVMLPNNAMIYPALESRNPFPLDWMIRNEHVGADEHLMRMIREVMSRREIFLVVDRFNSIEMAESPLEPMEYSRERFIYMQTLLDMSEPVGTESKYFRLYRTAPDI
ncbi:MAG: hypothetical protein JW861_12435 [Bacteroidales bacterium]|nr:hypothetical protein [Bacteroidales bacterium]